MTRIDAMPETLPAKIELRTMWLFLSCELVVGVERVRLGMVVATSGGTREGRLW